MSETSESTSRAAVSRKDRFLGAMLGLAIGDALGMPVEGLSQQQIAERHGWVSGYLPRLDANGVTELAAGEFTGDTELALCLLESLASNNGYLDVQLAGARMLRIAASETGRFLGPTTREALARAAASGDFQAGVAGDWRPGPGAAGRVAPLGLLHALGHFNPEIFTREVLQAGLITHADPEALNGALAVAYALRLLVNGDLPPELLLDEVAAFIDEDTVARRLRLAARLVPAGGDWERDRVQLQRIGGSSQVADVVAAALYCFATHPADFATAVLTAVNGGGDTDSVAAIAGALSGAHLGAAAIPVELVEGLEGRVYILMAAPGLYRAAQRRAGLLLRLIERE